MREWFDALDHDVAYLSVLVVGEIERLRRWLSSLSTQFESRILPVTPATHGLILATRTRGAEQFPSLCCSEYAHPLFLARPAGPLGRCGDDWMQ